MPICKFCNDKGCMACAGERSKMLTSIFCIKGEGLCVKGCNTCERISQSIKEREEEALADVLLGEALEDRECENCGQALWDRPGELCLDCELRRDFREGVTWCIGWSEATAEQNYIVSSGHIAFAVQFETGTIGVTADIRIARSMEARGGKLRHLNPADFGW